MLLLQHLDIFKDEENNCFQVRDKQSFYTIEFDDAEKEAVFTQLVQWYKTTDPSTSFTVFLQTLKATYAPEKVIDVLDNLKEYGLLEEKFDESQIALSKLQIKNILCIGDATSPFLAFIQTNLKITALFAKVEILHYADIVAQENVLATALAAADFTVVDASVYHPYALECINAAAIALRKPWLHIGGVEENKVHIGPLFFAYETGCYHCLAARLQSHDEFFQHNQPYINYLSQEKKIAATENYELSPSLFYHIIYGMMLVEIVKFFDALAVPETWKNRLSLSMHTYGIEKQLLLKKPYCAVCKPQLTYATAPWLNKITLS